MLCFHVAVCGHIVVSHFVVGRAAVGNITLMGVSVGTFFGRWCCWCFQHRMRLRLGWWYLPTLLKSLMVLASSLCLLPFVVCG